MKGAVKMSLGGSLGGELCCCMDAGIGLLAVTEGAELPRAV